MKLSIVILNYNARFFLEICLQSVLEAIQKLEAEIIVVDNNSSDESCKMVLDKFPEITLIRNTENLGFSKGNNIGVARATGDYICILNPDTIVQEDCFEDLLEFIETTSNPGIVGCQLIDGKGQFLPESKRKIPYPLVALKKLLGNGASYYASDIKANEVAKVDILVGAFMLLKTSVYRQIGGFDEDYFMYGEDIDLCYKALKKGYTNFYFGKTSVIHFKGESTVRDVTYAKRFYKAMQIFYNKHFSQGVSINVIITLVTKLAIIFNKKPKSVVLELERTYLYSKTKDKTDLRNCVSPVIVSSNIIKGIEDKSMLIYDLGSFTFSEVIEDMKQQSKKSALYFRFISRDGTFMLGSDSATAKGDITLIA